MKIKFWKKGSKSSGTIEEVHSRVAPTDEEVQFGFKKTVPNSTNKKPPSSPAKKESDSVPVKKPEKLPDDKNEKEVATLRNSRKSNNPEVSPGTKGSTKRRRQPSSKRLPPSSLSSSGSSTSRSSHEFARHNKHQHHPKHHYANGGLSSIDEELSRSTTRSLSERNHLASNPKLERNNSIMKLNSWVQLQKMKQHHRISDPQKYSSSILYGSGTIGTNRVPRGGRRNQIRSHSDFMDGNEPASSILSVPIIRHQQMTSLPRPKSSQDLNRGDGHNRAVVNWKSVGFLSPDYEKEAVRMTSEQILSRSQNQLSSGKEGTYTTQSVKRSRDNHITSPQPRTPSYFEAIKTGGNQAFRFDHAGQIRLQSPIKSPSWKIEEDGNDVEIEEKLNRLRKLEVAFKQIDEEINNFESRSKESNRVLSPRSYNADARSRAFRVMEKLKLVRNGCETLLNEINALKKERFEKLSRNVESKPMRHQLEWSLGRIQISLEKLKNMKKEAEEKQDKLNGVKSRVGEMNVEKSPSVRSSSAGSAPNGTLSPKSKVQKSPITPTPGLASDDRVVRNGQFFTLPRGGVYRSISSTSLGSGSIARFVQPLSVQKANLQRSKSAAERLLSSSHGNLAAGRDPDEVKKLQREINRNRRRTLSTGVGRKPSHQQNPHMQVGMDIKMAMKNYRMPKVLQRSKQQRAEIDRAARRDHTSRISSDPGPNVTVKQAPATNPSPKSNADHNLMQLIDIESNVVPRARLLKSTSDMSVEEKYDLEKKILAIERVMPRNGQNAFQPSNARLAAALAAEAASASKVISSQVQSNENSCFA